MKHKVLLFLLIFSLSLPCYGLEWKELHEKADSISSQEAYRYFQADPASLENLYVLGLVYLNEHKNSQAMGVFQRLLTQNPELIEARWGMAEVMRRMHKREKSEKILKEIIKSNPKFWPAYISLSYIQYMNMEFKNSLKSAYRVLKQKRKNVDLSNYVRAYALVAGAKGMIAHYGGPISKMVHGLGVFPLLKKAEKLQPDSVAVLLGIGSFHLFAPHIVGGNLDEGIQYLERAVSLDPLFAHAYVRLAQAYKMKGEPDKYQAFLMKALELDPENELANDIASGACKFLCARSPEE